MNDKTKEIMEQLEQGIKDTMNSERYKAFLEIQSRFHSYSSNNAMLIYLQNPDATRVAGFKTWEKLGRHVMRGEKGIGILAPSPYKYQKEIEVKNDKTGKAETKLETVEGLRFRKVTVFDVKQTDGKELPTLCDELQGNNANSGKIINAIKQISDCNIIEKNITSGAKGYYSRLENVIAVQEGMSQDQTAKTLIHEYAHSKLHNTEIAALKDRATKEVEAESVAYIVSKHFGVDTSEYSFEYLAAWSGDKDLKELKTSFDLIQKTANTTIEKMEDVLSKDLQLENSPVKIEIIWSESPHLEKGQILNFEEANALFKRLDQELASIRKETNLADYSNVRAGDDVPYVSYDKTKFQVQLSDGRTFEARFDIGESNYKNLADCINKECYIDVEKYIKENEIKNQQIDNSKINVNVLDKIKDLYSNEFPAIKHITEQTASIINVLNEQKGSIVSIKEIKASYKEAGKKLEQSNSKDDMQEFKTLRDVVDDFKQAQLTEKKVIARENSMKNQIDKSKTMEMVQ